jgi:hypothetical protein
MQSQAMVLDQSYVWGVLPTRFGTAIDARTLVLWERVGLFEESRHAYDHVAPDVLWELAQDDLPAIEKVCREELIVAEE